MLNAYSVMGRLRRDRHYTRLYIFRAFLLKTSETPSESSETISETPSEI